MDLVVGALGDERVTKHLLYRVLQQADKIGRSRGRRLDDSLCRRTQAPPSARHIFVKNKIVSIVSTYGCNAMWLELSGQPTFVHSSPDHARSTQVSRAPRSPSARQRWSNQYKPQSIKASASAGGELNPIYIYITKIKYSTPMGPTGLCPQRPTNLKRSWGPTKRGLAQFPTLSSSGIPVAIYM